MATSLAEKHRPATFQSVVGQDKAVAELAGRVIGHEFNPLLITGRVGSGKTTLARIFGRALVCRHPDGFGSACGRCSSCKATAKGSTPYYRVMDCAAGATASDVKDLVTNLQHAGMFGRAVCIMDEAHALSRAGFDALLGVLEPPHPKCTFVLITVDPTDIPITIRSRCASVQVGRVPESALVPLLRNICDEEDIAHTETALVQLSRFSDGIVRQALVDIDQLRDTGITDDAIRVRYGTGDYPIAMAYLKSVFDGKPFAVQADIIDRWAEDVERKVKILLRVLLYVAHNHYHKHIRFDPVLDAMPREPVKSLIQSISRSAAARSQDGSKLCDEAVIFWTQAARVSDVVFDGKILTFNHFIGSQPFSSPKASCGREAGSVKGGISVRTKGRRARPRFAAGVVSQNTVSAEHLKWREGAQIWDALSYMVQEHGKVLNMRVAITVAASKTRSVPYSISPLIKGINEVVHGAGRGRPLSFLFARIKETGTDGERHHVVAHLDPELYGAVHNWLHHLYHGKAGNRREDGVRLTLRYFNPSNVLERLRWHHHLCHIMVRGLDPRLVVAEGTASVALLNLLGVNERMRAPIGASAGRRFAISTVIGEGAQKASKSQGLPALSAFGIEAMRRLAEGWELTEHDDRNRWKAELSRRKAAIVSLTGDGIEPLAASAVRLGLREMVSEKSRDPYERQRSWPIWPRPAPFIPTLQHW